MKGTYIRLLERETVREVDQHHRRGAEALRRMVEEHHALIDGLVAIRHLGAPADAAVAELLALKPVNELRLSYELFEAVLEGVGVDIGDLLEQFLPLDLLDRLGFALWGIAPSLDPAMVPTPQLRLVPPLAPEVSS